MRKDGKLQRTDLVIGEKYYSPQHGQKVMLIKVLKSQVVVEGSSGKQDIASLENILTHNSGTSSNELGRQI